ncbi:polyprenyl synthetase family protein [bacterium]|nr:polyprenyl synthetase family protein [bacterium]MCB2202147.1 polyprenyl synthetase family protein [bacterium]
MKEYRLLVDELLKKHLPLESDPPTSLHAAMRYSTLAGGKRLRPILALSAWEFCGGEQSKAPDTIHLAMAALEMVHTYSLIHDDLPCMDDDDLRRGIPTCHKKFGEAVAVLAGDALHVVAFELMAKTGSTQAVIELAEAIGTSGMLGGQVADVEAEGRSTIAETEVEYIHTHKTGKLIRGAVRIGALLAGADAETLQRLTAFGEKIGLAFQIIDDILDIEGDQRKLGKQVGSDTKNQKATYPGVIGMAAAKTKASALIDEALELVRTDQDNMLQFLARYIGQREN